MVLPSIPQFLGEVTAFTPRSLVGMPKIIMMWNGSAGAWVVGDFLDIDLAVTTKGLGAAAKQHAAAISGLEVGVAMEATPIGEWGPVQIGGYYGDFSTAGTVASGANIATAVTAGLLLQGSATAGRAAAIPNPQINTTRTVAIALENAAANRCRCWLLNPLGL